MSKATTFYSLQPGKLYKTTINFQLKQKNGKSFEFKKNQVWLFIKRWESQDDHYFRFLKSDGQIMDIEINSVKIYFDTDVYIGPGFAGLFENTENQ